VSPPNKKGSWLSRDQCRAEPFPSPSGHAWNLCRAVTLPRLITSCPRATQQPVFFPNTQFPYPAHSLGFFLLSLSFRRISLLDVRRLNSLHLLGERASQTKRAGDSSGWSLSLEFGVEAGFWATQIWKLSANLLRANSPCQRQGCTIWMSRWAKASADGEFWRFSTSPSPCLMATLVWIMLSL
jgi:hypothetical protein